MGKVIEIESYEDIPEYTGLSNTKSIEVKDNCEWNGHAYATCVGMIYDDGAIESYFKADKENGNTEIFDKLRNDIGMIKKHINFVDCETMKEKSGNRYFIPYRVKNHCSNKPTVIDSYVDGCSNVHYSVEYEIILIADEEFKRYITVEYETEGHYSSCFFDQVECIENMFQEWFEEGTHEFKITEDDCKTVTFYDETGESSDVEIFSIDELLSMITSIRVIKCEQNIIS